MESVNKDVFELKEVNLCYETEKIVNRWKPLLERKHISISIEYDSSIELKIQIVDLNLLINNFILNSSYFLEEANADREITIRIYKDTRKIHIDMMNNGPTLDKRFIKMPDESLEPRVTSKTDGSGLGLWFAREAVQRCDGELHVIPIESGYLLRASWLL